MRATPTNAQAAARWKVDVRTVQRWKAAGVDVHDLDSVSEYVGKLSNGNLDTMKAVGLELADEALRLISEPRSVRGPHPYRKGLIKGASPDPHP